MREGGLLAAADKIANAAATAMGEATEGTVVQLRPEAATGE